MKSFRVAVATLATVVAVGSWYQLHAQLPSQPQFPGAPLAGKGEAIYPAMEGWGPLPDGSNAIVIGYYNRNRDQVIDIPIGPNNHFDPGPADMGQPTHFEPGRQWGVFAIKVPKDFGNKKLTWTLVANGITTTVQFSLNPPYWVDFFKNSANGNTPPLARLTADGKPLSGPPTEVAQTLTATVNQPLPLKLWVSDKANTYDPEEGLPDNLRSRGRGRGGDQAAAAAAARGRAAGAAPNFDVSAANASGQNRGRGRGIPADATVTWKVHRGAAPVKFADETIRLQNKGDVNAVMEASTTATFSAPGDYTLRGQVNDASGDGGGGEQCCWTNVIVKVNVK